MRIKVPMGRIRRFILWVVHKCKMSEAKVGPKILREGNEGNSREISIFPCRFRIKSTIFPKQVICAIQMIV